MKVNHGIHKNRSVEYLVLKEPGYINWLINTQITGPMLLVKNEAKRLISIFDNKPMIIRCQGNCCSSNATNITVYRDNLSPCHWCDICNPYQLGAIPGRIQVIRTYCQALDHVNNFCQGRQSDFKDIIKKLAQAKGLPSHVGKNQATSFFQSP